MPTQENINEIASYLKSFEDGTRRHNQQDIHSCKSSHCLAGWKAYEDATKEGLVIDDWGTYDYLDGSTSAESKKLEHFCATELDFQFADEMDYAAQVWGLNDKESDLLFDGDLTLEQMKNNLKSIATSHGLNYDY